MTDIRALADAHIRKGWCVNHTDSVTLAQFALKVLDFLEESQKITCGCRDRNDCCWKNDVMNGTVRELLGALNDRHSRSV